MSEFLGLINVCFILLIIAIAVFFFWKWLLKKYIKGDRKRKFAIWFATLILTPLFSVGIFILLTLGITYITKKDFNKSEWLTDEEARFKMADEIIESRMLVGIDTTQLKIILGDPSFRDDTYQKWTYDMGLDGNWISPSFHTLDLTIDEYGNVMSVDHLELRDNSHLE